MGREGSKMTETQIEAEENVHKNRRKEDRSGWLPRLPWVPWEAAQVTEDVANDAFEGAEETLATAQNDYFDRDQQMLSQPENNHSHFVLLRSYESEVDLDVCDCMTTFVHSK